MIKKIALRTAKSLIFVVIMTTGSLSALAESKLEQSESSSNTRPQSSEQGSDAGKGVFGQCSACHMPSGEGVVGAFPPLRGRVASLAETENGRLYLASVLLNGMNGAIKVKDVSYNGFMLAYGHILSDQQISEVLNYVALELTDTPVDGFQEFSTKEISEARLLLESSGKTSPQLRKDALH